MGHKYLIMEDDCAPDAREYFDKELLTLYGFTRKDFVERGIYVESENGLHCEWWLGEYILEYDGDDPFYKFRRKGV